ncbi:MAG TPA: FAD-linked oxidase C-terminal domain-containing protein [bacterium]|nr:FAD-linked oxidase C-terminal domain-containing protein [bacterium]
MREYTKADNSDIEFFRELIGEKYVITGGDDMEPYTHDETEDFIFEPDVVVRPAKTEEVSRIMKRCWERGIAVTPRGGGTGLSGGALCVKRGVCLSLDRMAEIIEIDTKNLIAIVEPGVIVENLHNAVEELDLFYPPDPASRGTCMIGGNLAECAGGARALKYGVTRDYVLGCEAVLPDGRIINTGGKLLKNVTGYDLTNLIVGSEGTLAVITKIFLKLIPRPSVKRTLLAPFDSMEQAAVALNAIFINKVVPCAAEFMERDAIQSAEKMLGKSFPYSDSEALLLIELDGNDVDSINRELEKVGMILLDEQAKDVLVAESSQRQKEMWDMRSAIGEAVKKISAYKEEDTVVPRAQLPELLKKVKEISKKHGFTTICYGHAGDGNIHANIIKGDMDDRKWRDELPVLISDIHRAVVALGGMISGEHGIGYTQRMYMPLALSETVLELMKSVKDVFDPKGILNPDKVFPEKNERD